MNKQGRIRYIIILSLPLFVVALYVGFSALNGGPGFPLDDSWIHQTYARNLAQTGRWAYLPGETSVGSTAPLWTLLLTMGYVMDLPYLFWAYLGGALSLILLAWAGMGVWRALWPQRKHQDWLPGLALVLTWPLVWAAASGMETLLFIALGMLLIWLYVKQDRRLAGWMGLLAGFLVLARPDGLLLLLLVAGGLMFRPERWSLLWRFSVGVALPLIPYFILNLAASGELWPTTFYAKQAEYALLLHRPIPWRYLSMLFFSLGGTATGESGMTGAHLLLLPGILIAGWAAIQRDWSQRQLLHLLPLLWAFGHVFLFAWRLPVTYQHGRYLWAAIPIWILYGLAGWLDINQWLGKRGILGRVAGRAAVITYGVMLAIYFILGLQAYATDVAFIEGEMVQAAHWLQENTAADTLIAAHDIGAIGYFAQRPLLDTAGLISPEIVPILADEEAMAAYIVAQGAEYLVTAPGWPYALITSRPGVQLLYRTNYQWTQEQGLNNMTIYRLP